MYAVENVNQYFKLVKTLPNPKSLKSHNHILALSFPFAKNPDELTSLNRYCGICLWYGILEYFTL